MPQYDLTEFLKLSSVLNYNLSAASLNRYNVMMYIIGGKTLDQQVSTDRGKKGILMDALGYLFSAYHQKRRRLGPMAVLHPLRATALFARYQDQLNLIDLLSVLFHDIMEDINPYEQYRCINANRKGILLPIYRSTARKRRPFPTTGSCKIGRPSGQYDGHAN
jgi:hypothetical protein